MTNATAKQKMLKLWHKSIFDASETLEEYAQAMHRRLQITFNEIPAYKSVENTYKLFKEQLR